MRAPEEDGPSPCPGCGVRVPEVGTPAPSSVGASSGCWAAYGEVLAKEYGAYRYPPIHFVTVHAYAAQHPGAVDTRSHRSLALHLLGLYLFCERGVAPEDTAATMRGVGVRGFPILEPPAFRGALTVLDVFGADSFEAHVQRVEQWARAVWAGWASHHAVVREWCTHAGAGR